MEQHRVDALLPGGALVDQGLTEPHRGAQVQDPPRPDPRGGQPTLGEQLAEQPGVGPVGLGAPLAATQAGGIGRLGQVRGQPSPLQLLDDKPPAGARLHRERAAVTGQPGEPLAKARSGRRHDPTPAGLPAVGVHPVEGDLASVHVQPAYDAHLGPPSSSAYGPPARSSVLEPEGVPAHVIFSTAAGGSRSAASPSGLPTTCEAGSGFTLVPPGPAVPSGRPPGRLMAITSDRLIDAIYQFGASNTTREPSLLSTRGR